MKVRAGVDNDVRQGGKFKQTTAAVFEILPGLQAWHAAHTMPCL